KMPAFEWVHVQLHQQKGMISLSPPTICNSALKGAISEKETQPSGRELNISGGNNRIAGRDYNETKGR
ncbi:hypothetical protein V7J58_16350, partial [Escherichia coli]